MAETLDNLTAEIESDPVRAEQEAEWKPSRDIALILVGARLELGVSQAGFAKRAGVSQSYVAVGIWPCQPKHPPALEHSSKEWTDSWTVAGSGGIGGRLTRDRIALSGARLRRFDSASAKPRAS